MTRAASGVATLGPVGYWPVGPGTAASALVGALWLAPIPVAAWALAAVVATMLGIPVTGRAERALGHDDGRIVLDEAAGMAIAALGAPRSAVGAVVAFALFRAFDILKPPPIGRLQRAPGGWGVMLDDVAAGLAAALVAWGGFRLLGGAG